MKLNKDNYELVMFDLLEGNLSEKDELLVMDQIEGDEFLFREWKLFKSTILIADKEVTYNRKSSLLKKETVAVLPMYTKWLAIAASVCILAVAIVFWPKTENPTLVDNDKAIETNLEETMPLVESVVDEKTELVVEQNDEIRNTTSTRYKTNEVAPQNYVSSVSKEFETAEGYQTKEQENLAQAEMQKRIDNARKSIDKKLLDIHNSNKIQAELLATKDENVENKQEEIVERIKEPILLEKPSQEAVVAEVPKTRNQKILDFVTNKPIERITTTTAAILVKVRNPKLKMKPSFKNKRPSLDIEFESEGYQAIASLQPFKNKNN